LDFVHTQSTKPAPTSVRFSKTTARTATALFIFVSPAVPNQCGSVPLDVCVALVGKATNTPGQIETIKTVWRDAAYSTIVEDFADQGRGS
ncbi:unnamed protein product, partial [Ectocarpus sp. 8 AP-2014]